MLPMRNFITAQAHLYSIFSNLLQQEKIALSCSLLHNLSIFETLTLSAQEDRECSKTGKTHLENEEDTMYIPNQQ